MVLHSENQLNICSVFPIVDFAFVITYIDVNLWKQESRLWTLLLDSKDSGEV